MTRENILFSIIGVLLGYAVASTFVLYANRGAGAGSAVAATGAPAAQSRNLPADHPDISQGGGAAGAGQEETRRLVEQAESEARADPKNFESQVRAAGMNADAGDLDDALDFLTRAHDLRPDDYETVVLLGDINYEARRYEVAERWWKEALAKRPDDIEVRTDLGLAYFMRGPEGVEKALSEFRRSLEQSPEHERTLHNLTHVLTRKGDLDEAGKTLARLEKVSPSNPGLEKLRQSLEEARASLKAAPAANAGDKKKEGK